MKIRNTVWGIVGLVITVSVPAMGWADQNTQDSPPACLDKDGNNLPDNDSQVIQWKSTTENEFLSRAHVTGTIKQVYPNENGHAHFSISLDSAGDSLEVIYNLSFGPLPKLAPGMSVEACGDYITSNAPGNGYPASPDGAIIHWIHKSNNTSKHESGYVAVNGTTYGLLNGHGD